MKLASIKNNTRDGQLVVVNRALTKAVTVSDIAHTLQQALDNWQQTQPALEDVYQRLNRGELDNCIDFIEKDCESPLPRVRINGQMAVPTLTM